MKDYPNTFVCLFLHNVYINPLIMNELYFCEFDNARRWLI